MGRKAKTTFVTLCITGWMLLGWNLTSFLAFGVFTPMMWTFLYMAFERPGRRRLAGSESPEAYMNRAARGADHFPPSAGAP